MIPPLARAGSLLKENPMNRISQNGLSKVPEVTLAFWIIKIAATTLGETGGDAVSMSMHLGYAIGSAIFIGIFVVAVAAQIAARIPPVPVLGRDHRDHDSGHDDGGLCRSLPWHRLCRGIVDPVRAPYGLTRRLVLVGRFRFG